MKNSFYGPVTSGVYDITLLYVILLDDFKEMRCWKLKEEALGRTVWRTCFGRVRQIAYWWW
jgi:hypothetical protein